jgi:hypothetical protein
MDVEDVMAGFQDRRRVSRVRPSGLVSKAATIITDAKKPGVACTVIDISAGGAALELADTVPLPKRFWLMHGKTKKSCLTVWQKHRRIGVQF